MTEAVSMESANVRLIPATYEDIQLRIFALSHEECIAIPTVIHGNEPYLVDSSS